MKRRVVITGLGVIAPNGIGKVAFWDALENGRSGIGKITRFDASTYPSKIAGEVKDFNPFNYLTPKKIKRMGRASQLAIAAAKMAIQDSKFIINDQNSNRIGVVIGLAAGHLDVAANAYEIFYEKGMDRLPPHTVSAYFPNSSTGSISAEFHIKGPSMTISTGCSSGVNAVAYAYDMIRNSICDQVIAGGTEAPITPFGVGAFCAMGNISTHNNEPERACRPFDLKRNGFVLSEGAAVCILESLDKAIERKAFIYGEIMGSATTSSTEDMVVGDNDGRGFTNTIMKTIDVSNLEPDDIDCINAHACGSKILDALECNAIKRVFKKRAYSIPIISIKSMIGHPLAAVGPLQVASSVLILQNKIIPPTINYKNIDPECDLDFVPNKARKVKTIKTILVNDFGYGGNNIGLVLQKY